jgi:predicted phage terminase large subunit-like protein
MKLSKDRTAVDDWETEEGGGLRAVGVGAGVTGMGANWIFIDDPVKNREEANSETYREKCWDWYTDDLYTRLEPGGKIVLIMTRWHEDDLAGRILASEDGPNWTVINLPALAEKDDPLGRKEGEALCPERYDEEALQNIRRVMGASFQALYQQRPSAEEGDIFKREWWQYYKEAPKLKWIIQSWDTAFKKGAENDYSVCHTWGVSDNGFYLLDRWKEKVEFPTLKRTVVSLANKWHPRAILIEDKASGQSLIQELKTNTTLPVLAIPVDSDKVTRAHAVTPSVEAGNCYLPEDAPWLQDFIDEFATFPNGSHDDEVDATTQFLNYVRRRGEAAFKDFAEAAEKTKPKGHVWRPQEGTPYYRCDQCGIMVKVSPGQNAQDVATSKGMAQCTPT